MPAFNFRIRINPVRKMQHYSGAVALMWRLRQRGSLWPVSSVLRRLEGCMVARQYEPMAVRVWSEGRLQCLMRMKS